MPSSSKKIEAIAMNNLKTRKQEEFEDDDDMDDWGDIKSSAFKTDKLETNSYYNSSTGTEVVYCQSTATKINGTKCYPLFIGGAGLKHGFTESS